VAAAGRFPPALVASGCTFAGPVATETIEATDSQFRDGVISVVTSVPEACSPTAGLDID
jgi:hypothetical protein